MSVAETKLQSYRQVATHGIFWNITMAGANKVVTLVGQVVLAWVLVPRDMGLAGMATAMAGFALFLGASSVGDVLVQRGRYKEEVGQAFWLSLCLSVSTAVLIALLSPVAGLLGRPQLSRMILILAFLPLADCLSPVLTSALKANLEFKHLAISQCLAGVTYTVFAVVLALLGLGPYALIIPVIPRALSLSAFMLLKAGLPKWERPRWDKIREFIKPSFSLSLTSFLTGLQAQAPVFCVGLIMNATATGYFSWGWQVAGQAVFLLSVNLRQVLMPVIAKMAGESERQAGATLRAARAITAVLMIACCFQALLAEPVLNLFFPEKWRAAGPVIVWISIGLAFQGIYICVTSWLNGTGRYKELLFLSALPVLLTSTLVYLGGITQGIDRAAQGTAVGLFLSSVAALSLFPKIVLQRQFKKLITPVLITLIVWVAVYLFFPENDNLFIETVGAVFFLMASVYTWWHWSEGEVRDIWLKIIEKVRFLETAKETVCPVKPNFFIIGAPRSGTTALTRYLKDHPNIFFSSIKEPYYFDTDLSVASKMGDKAYLSLFSKADPEFHKAIGEGSTSYLFSEKAAENILKFDPGAKFIVMLRNPVDLVQSLHAHNTLIGIEPLLNFEEAWRAEADRREGKKLPTYCLETKALLYSEWGKLGQQMWRLFSVVDRSQVKVIIFDDFVSDTKKVYEDVLGFLNVPSDRRKEFPRVNENKKLTRPWLQKAFSFIVYYGLILRSVFGITGIFGVFNKLIAINSKFDSRKSISDSLQAELKAFYREDIIELSNLVGRDLSCWVTRNGDQVKSGEKC